MSINTIGGLVARPTLTQALSQTLNVPVSGITYSDTGVNKSLNSIQAIHHLSSAMTWLIPSIAGEIYKSFAPPTLVTDKSSYDLTQFNVDRGNFHQKPQYTFSAGFTLTNGLETVVYEGVEYRWGGTFPKTAAAGSTPSESGWVRVNQFKEDIAYLKSIGNVEGWRAGNPDDTDCINAALASGSPHVFTDSAHGEYLVRSGVLYVRKGQSFDCSKAKLKRIDGESNRKNLLEAEDGMKLSADLDGNYQNNIADAGTWTSVDASPFAQNLYLGRRDTSSTGTVLANNCHITYLNSYNAIRSCIIPCGDGHQIDELIAGDSYVDHQIYYSASSNIKINRALCYGMCRAASVIIGTNAQSRAENCVIDDLTVKDITYTKFPWYELPPRYVSATYQAHRGIKIGNLTIVDTSVPLIEDSLQIHRRLAIYESDSPMEIGSIRVKTLVAPARSLITVENNSAVIGSIHCEYETSTTTVDGSGSSILKVTGASAKPVGTVCQSITTAGNGMGSSVVICDSAKVSIESITGMTGATNFGTLLKATATYRDAMVSVRHVVGGSGFFTQFSSAIDPSTFSAVVDLISSALSRITITGGVTVNNPGSNLIKLAGTASAENPPLVNRLRYFTPGRSVTLIGDGTTVLQNTSYLITKSGANTTTAVDVPYTFSISYDGKAYQL